MNVNNPYWDNIPITVLGSNPKAQMHWDPPGTCSFILLNVELKYLAKFPPDIKLWRATVSEWSQVRRAPVYCLLVAFAALVRLLQGKDVQRAMVAAKAQ